MQETDGKYILFWFLYIDNIIFNNNVVCKLLSLVKQ